jgi:hypothetical protein
MQTDQGIDRVRLAPDSKPIRTVPLSVPVQEASSRLKNPANSPLPSICNSDSLTSDTKALNDRVVYPGECWDGPDTQRARISNRSFFQACRVCRTSSDFIFLHYVRWFGFQRAQTEAAESGWTISRALLAVPEELDENAK